MSKSSSDRGDAKIRRDADELFAKLRQRIPRPARLLSQELPTTDDSRIIMRDVKRWMRNNAAGYETATQLVESAVAEFDIPAPDEQSPLWDFACLCLTR